MNQSTMARQKTWPLVLLAACMGFMLSGLGMQTASGGKSQGGNQTSDWQPPRFSERQEARERMVQNQIVERGLDTPDSASKRVYDAMRHVPRHLFVSEQQRNAAYADRPLPIDSGQTISQPYIVALMTAKLSLEPGDKVLEIGTGSGYQAAVLSEITPYVYSVEILKPLAEKAKKRLSELGYDVVTVRTGDGYYGFEEHAPFDGIIVTCAAGHIPPPLLKQLKKGGTMVVPIGGAFEVQRLTLVTKDEDGEIRTKALMPVRFVPMTGEMSS
ncbi:MAG: protein-L-isoaspartate(D-aspartate) O-methyltransferase [Desulfovermiculus sp.]